MLTPVQQLEQLSQKLRQLYSRVLEVEKPFHPPQSQLALLDRLIHDPQWAWLRPLSVLTADIDHVLALPEAATEYDLMVATAHARELLTGGGPIPQTEFLERYRALLQLSPELVSTHGEVIRLLRAAPAEPENEAERLHHRHQWAMRCKQRRQR
jgi:hypothetical protein